MENTSLSNIFPFVKWVGGKREVIKKHLHCLVPKKYNTYVEPFVGGGAMLFYLRPKEAIINDINYELITTYKLVQENVYELIEKLDEFSKKKNEKDYYLIRSTIYPDSLNISARFIFLNKMCFNGIYRVNSKGMFNVPYNKNNKSNLYSKENLINMSAYFNKCNIKFFNNDYKKILNMAKTGDFIFCDPPYDYEEGVKGFDSYTKSGFNQKKQIELAKELKKAHEKGCMFMLTNHNTKLINELYKEFKIYSITTNRFINSISDRRINSGKEVVILNYEI